MAFKLPAQAASHSTRNECYSRGLVKSNRSIIQQQYPVHNTSIGKHNVSPHPELMGSKTNARRLVGRLADISCQASGVPNSTFHSINTSSATQVLVHNTYNSVGTAKYIPFLVKSQIFTVLKTSKS